MAKTVLIVDDVPFVRKALVDILTEAHYEVVGEAANGQEAIAKYTELRPDFVTMDIVMPIMSGIEATRRLVKADKDAKVIIISAMGQEGLVMEAVAVGARDYILKPFTKDEVLKTVENALTSDSQKSRGAQAEAH
jgi:two-component system chemotaxis response regulator CheY